MEYIEEETYAKADQTSIPWYLDRIDQRSQKLDGLYKNDYTGEDVYIYVIDTGMMMTLEDFI